MDTDIKYTKKEFPEAFKELINKKKWSYQQAADRIGISKGYVGQIINRDVNVPKDKYIEKIAKGFNIDPEYFFEYRLRRMTEYAIKNLDYLDDCYSKMTKIKKERSA